MADKKVIRTIGVLTSGGDAPGMNAAIRAVVRTALGKGLKVRGIRRGYQGLLNEEIIDLSARDVSDTIERGGTILQTARCAEMRTEEGQQKAAAICKKYGIDLMKSYAYGDTHGDYSMLLSVGHPRAINPSLELLNSIKESDYLKKNTEIIIERKDVIYKVHSDVETL